jgi:hypothetical protein
MKTSFTQEKNLRQERPGILIYRIVFFPQSLKGFFLYGGSKYNIADIAFLGTKSCVFDEAAETFLNTP